MITGAKRFGVRVLVGLLVFAMAAYGIENFFLGNTNQAAVEVNGEELPQAMIDNEIQSYRQTLLSTYGQQFVDAMSEQFIATSAENQLIQRVLLRQNADQLRLTATDGMVNNYLVGVPDFQLDGKFSVDALQAYLTGNRLTLAQFQDNMRSSIGQKLLYDSFVSGQSIIHPNLLNLASKVLFASAHLVYAQINDHDLVKLIAPSKQQVESYYQDHSGDYRQPAQASFRYLTFKLADFTVDVTEPNEQQIEFAYQEKLSELLTKVEEYEVSHILITTEGRTTDEARELAGELRARIDQENNFDQLASEYSEDSGSANQGGSLGKITLDLLATEFADQVRLMQSGEISQPVLSDFGYHIIRLDASPTSNSPSLEELRDELRNKLIKREAQASYSQALDKLRNLTGGATNLLAAASELQLETQTSPEITITGTVDANIKAGVFGNPKVREAAFTEQVIEQKLVSEVIDLGDAAIVLLLDNYNPGRQLDLDEVLKTVTEATRLELAKLRGQLLTTAITKLQPQIAAQDNQRDWLIKGDWKSAITTDLNQQQLSESLAVINFVEQPKLQRQLVSQDTSPTSTRLSNLVFAAGVETGIISTDQASDNNLVYLTLSTHQSEFAELDEEQQQLLKESLTQANSGNYDSQLFSLLKDQSSIIRN